MTGDSVMQFGNFNIGMVKSQGPVDQRAAHEQMIDAVLAIRAHVPEPDRAVIDDSLSILDTDGPVDRGRFRQALGAIGGIAALLGATGAPVIESIGNVMEAFGLS
ncbi:hypothetical protein [Streptomyces liliifuscus]|uniref:Uncharacterized protein n=1 Tax=Streptomyces liliifuscus TaxID=2797636 RepID=A0A7T7I5L0_9ACTN|nr:hypothetical protein [Streptomyces liliifuscus]QQM41453.1 hypothetical protein JEQ17_19610 [Streptomyces liliifuscus]